MTAGTDLWLTHAGERKGEYVTVSPRGTMPPSTTYYVRVCGAWTSDYRVETSPRSALDTFHRYQRYLIYHGCSPRCRL